MSQSIQPLASFEHTEALETFLRQRGVPPELFRWKYLDEAFNHERPRGFVSIADDAVTGFVGIIPFRAVNHRRTWDAGWLCDWYSESPGPGAMLLLRAVRAAGQLLAIGEGRESGPVLKEVARKQFEGAAAIFRLPLRFGAIVDRQIKPKVPWLGLDRLPVVGSIRLKRPRTAALQDRTRTEPGVARVIASLLERRRVDGVHPHYDLSYVDWQVGRCPQVQAGTSYIPGDPVPAAAVFWNSARSGNSWHLALWGLSPDHRREMRAVLSEAVRRIDAQGGALVSMAVSRNDTELIELLRDNGFLRSGQSWPLSILCSQNEECLGELQGLSYLDADWPSVL